MEKLREYGITIVYPTRDVCFKTRSPLNPFDLISVFESNRTHSFVVSREDKNQEIITLLPGYIYTSIVELIEEEKEELEKDATTK